MFALIDCNSFFCSVEQAFRPELKGKPVCVLGGNDGCIVALTPEAKAVGLRRGEPFFKCKSLIEQHHVITFSSDLKKYADVSAKIFHIVRNRFEKVEKYSIDECFCDLKGYSLLGDLAEMMRAVVDEIRCETDVPVSVGIAPTKTLAKVGSKYAKQYRGFNSVCLIDSDEKRRKALEKFDLSDVWGIGRRTFVALASWGIGSPLEFADKSEQWVKSRFGLPTYQTWLELNGTPCIESTKHERQKSISESRSFGKMQADFQSVQAAVARYASHCAAKLRQQNSVARTVTVWLSTNAFRDDLDQYQNGASITLPEASADTIEIIGAATNALKQIFRENFLYKKAGVLLTDICDDTCIELNLFDPVKNRPARRRLMETIDQLNQKHGKPLVEICSAQKRV